VCIEPKTQGLPAGVGIAIVGQGSASFGETKPGVNQMQKTLPSAVGEPERFAVGSIAAGERPGGSARTECTAIWGAARTNMGQTTSQGLDRTLTILTSGTSEQVRLGVHYRQCVPGASLGRLPLQGSLLPRHRLRMDGRERGSGQHYCLFVSTTRTRGPYGRRLARVGDPAAGKPRGSPNGS
jgi:hypothetical protein